MKKHLSFILLLTMFVSGCVKNDLEEKPLQPVSGRVFTASFESENARTYVEEGNLLRWNAGDQIALFDSNTLNRQYQFDGETGDNAGTFSTTLITNNKTIPIFIICFNNTYNI